MKVVQGKQHLVLQQNFYSHLDENLIKNPHTSEYEEQVLTATPRHCAEPNPRHEELGSGVTAPRILNLGTGWG